MVADIKPLIVSRLGAPEQTCRALERAPLKPDSKDKPKADLKFQELWLQTLIQDHPALLSISQIEPGLADAVPICLELELPCGNVDNLLLTPSGGIVVVETKLWRNPEARRQVVAQILDYAKDMSRLTFDELQATVRQARHEPNARLADLVLGEAAGTEAETRFVDGVARNLRLGRFLLLIVGDGIQEGAEELANFIQRHLGLHFTLGLVEVSVWELPDGEGVLVHPRVLARTVQIERAVIRLEEGVALTAPQIEPAAVKTSKPTTISEEAFFEQLAAVDPSLPTKLKSFRAELMDYGIDSDIQRTLMLRWQSPDARKFPLGAIFPDGTIATDYCHDAANLIGRVDLSHAYQADLAVLVPGASIRQTPSPTGWRAVLGGKNLPVVPLLERKADWLAAIERYIVSLRTALESASDS